MSSESDINIDLKISSKSLNSINERKMYISNKTSSLPPSATSSDPSFPMLNASSVSTRSLTNRNYNANKQGHKYKQQQQQLLKNNLSTTTTLEISSFMSDSLYNSNFIVTPMCSDAMSPALFTNFIKSPNIPQGSPQFNSNSMFSSSIINNNNNPLTPKATTTLKPSASPSPSSNKPVPKSYVPLKTTPLVFPSPPSISTKYHSTGNSPLATPTDSFPLPPTFLDCNNLKDKTSTLELDLESQTSNSTEPLVQTNGAMIRDGKYLFNNDLIYIYLIDY